MNMSEYLFAICKRLDSAGVEYAITGGFAFSLHVIPRATVDIDIIAVAGSIDPIESVMRDIFPKVIRHRDAMKLSRIELFRIIGITEGDETIVDVIIPSDAELLGSIINRRIRIELEGCKLPVVSIEDLYVLKHFSERLQDKSDCEMIKKFHGFGMDWEYIDTWTQ